MKIKKIKEKAKYDRVLKAGMRPPYSVFANWLYPGKKNHCSFSFMIRSSFAGWSKAPLSSEVKLLSSHRKWEIEVLSFLMITYQKDGSKSLRKTFLGCKTGKVCLKDLHFKDAEKEFVVTSFLK